MDKWLPSRQGDELSVERLDLFQHFHWGHFLEVAPFHRIHGVAIGAAEVASEQTDKDGGGACADTLTLYAEEYFRDFHELVDSRKLTVVRYGGRTFGARGMRSALCA